MNDDDDVTDYVLRVLWDQVHALALELSEPEYIYESIIGTLVVALQHQALPGKDVAALLVEIFRDMRNKLIDLR